MMCTDMEDAGEMCRDLRTVMLAWAQTRPRRPQTNNVVFHYERVQMQGIVDMERRYAKREAFTIRQKGMK